MDLWKVIFTTKILCAFIFTLLELYTLPITYLVCNKIPLIWLAWDWTGAELLNIPDYQMVPLLTYVLTGNLLLLLLYLGCTTIRVFHLDISFICWFTVIRVLFCVFWGLHRWRSWWNKRQRGRRNHNSWCTDSLGAFLNMSLISACFIDEAFFLVKSKNLRDCST